MFELLLEIKNILLTIGAKSVELGIEEGISADDTPFIRIVPSVNETGEFNREDLEFEVYIGTDIKETLQETYQEHMDFVVSIKSALHLKQIGTGICYFQRAVFDKDVVKNFKVAMMSFALKDIS
ncbi:MULTISPECIES: hypothetical protein [unclassified Nitratiruptor]|uniref:hypothetical protein n=1 Tax=unclassified Nitratiruptor TaxID=2624044 RepID=UPI001915A696|nr:MULTISPECIES: hypothetical protein [unclassified Nitratiruptor]BCD59625.1 hypothetical protein NitYY0810_C0376 [Nitratiruptor sp. YY08-10]BCD63549.1 hypothetical protein NitYY0814_C0376 [Nitratiruptor sp. YY08-14]BCD83101.1 hypothetical protein NrS2_51 [Nitratiruptor phage NrS-2]BCD83167.1 hypothetical protein NrS3_51 [Nitratiruptor phage NrS-3]